MVTLVHFHKTDTTVRTTASTSPVELTNYTITAADLTGAGLAAGDDVLILVAVKHWAGNVNQWSHFAVGFGTSFAGRTEDTTSIEEWQPVLNTHGHQYIWFDRRTLVASENIYFRGQATAAVNSSYVEFVCLILKLGGLLTTDWLYDEQTHSGDAPDTYDTSGAGAATPASGDWLIFAMSHWLHSVVATDSFTAIHDGTSDISEVKHESEGITDKVCHGTFAYKAALGSAVTVRTRYRSATAATNDVDATKIFGLRLDMFEDHNGLQTANTVTHSVLDTYQEVAGFPTYGLTTTGPFFVLGWPIHTTPQSNKTPYGRIQIGGSDWPAAGANGKGVQDNGADQLIAPLLTGYNAAQTAATLDIDMDCAENVDISPTYNCTAQVAAAFSLTLVADASRKLILTRPA